MGYLSSHIINSIFYQYFMDNLKIYTSKDFNYLYNSYANNKSHWLSLPNISINHYSKIELFVIDFTSPISVSI